MTFQIYNLPHVVGGYDKLAPTNCSMVFYSLSSLVLLTQNLTFTNSRTSSICFLSILPFPSYCSINPKFHFIECECVQSKFNLKFSPKLVILLDAITALTAPLNLRLALNLLNSFKFF